MKKVLVTGGTGYIGSHTIVDLINHGFEVISVDDYSNSTPQALEGIQAITGKTIQNYVVDLKDLEATAQIFKEHRDLMGVIHFAAHKLVGESVEKPLTYFRNNLNSLLNIIDCMQQFEVKNLIFSSSCSVYGNAEELPVTEETPMREAESPYARTKQMGEQICVDVARQATDHNFVLLRYFNPAGAHASALLGENPANAPSNLVPVITETAIGKRQKMTVFGADYDTRDGSCIRDYIHVMDLANAHTKAMEYLIAGNNPSNLEVFNLGIGEGVSVLEAIKAFETVSGQPLNYEIGPRRPGDVIAIYAQPERAKSKLNWKPERDIEAIMASAWAWEKRRSGEN